MAKKSYIGVDSKARQIKKWYLGVDNKARKVKKGYIGVGGVARPYLSSGTNYGYIKPLYYGMSGGVSTKVGKYAVFYGGSKSDVNSNTYSPSLVHSRMHAGDTGVPLQLYRQYAAAASFGNQCFIVGGFVRDQIESSPTTKNSWFVGFNSSCVSNTNGNYDTTEQAYGYLVHMAAGVIGDHALFAGGYRTVEGYDTDTSGYNPRVFPITESGTVGSLLVTSKLALSHMSTATIGDYILFAGGYYQGVASNSVTCFNKNLVSTTVTQLPVSYGSMGGASIGNYAIFAGGSERGNLSSAVTAYSSNLVQSTLQNLDTAVGSMAAVSTSKYAYFIGGDAHAGNYTSVIRFNSNLTRTVEEDGLISTIYSPLASTTGNYVLVAASNGTVQAIIDQ